ncbi:hypothetical protein PENSPDRAFT_694721 [Peniophora sp. CONT]|nr:hypothetical protein PENSPDRAFT_694721 [Peniophora sp. CONT]
MPLAPVSATSDDSGSGIQLYYEDSGAPPDCAVYTTLVFLHGTGFSGAIFHRLLPFASTIGLRLVLVNRRDYPGTTPLSDNDISLVAEGSSQEENEEFLFERALELTRFLAWFVREGNVPPISNSGTDERKGGLSIVAWSSSNTVVMSLMANLARVPDDLRDALEPYIRSYIHYDGPRWALGYPDSEHFVLAHPLMDASLSEDEKFARFKHWVSAYYDHPDIASRELSCLTEDMTSTERTSTSDRLTAEEDAATSSYYALVHGERFVRALSPSVLLRNRNRALFEYDPEHITGLDLWPKVPVKMLQCEKSLWDMISALWETEDAYKTSLLEKRPVRQMEFHILEGCNHFAHWDDPEKTIKCLAKIA